MTPTLKLPKVPYVPGRQDLSILPAEVLDEGARVMHFGAGKHGRDNWREAKNNGGDHLEAARRHITRHKRGTIFDHETGCFHLAHALARVAMALGKEMQRPKCPSCAAQLPKLRAQPQLHNVGFHCLECKTQYPAFVSALPHEIRRPEPKERVPARQTRIFSEIIAERKRQDAKHGKSRRLGDLKRLAILGEEFGEVAMAINDHDRENMREELIQVAACCVDWLEELDRCES
jgi:NTP pyrophosphatase (non-canonical NTP hydrolase)